MAPLEMTLDPSTRVLPDLRRSVKERLQSIDEPSADWELIATELVTNAIEASEASQPIEVRLKATDATIELTVVDQGPGFELQPASQPVPSTHLGGRGLMIVRSLSDALETRRVDGHTITRCIRSRLSARAAGDRRRENEPRPGQR